MVVAAGIDCFSATNVTAAALAEAETLLGRPIRGLSLTVL
jgi:hypothetical protein